MESREDTELYCSNAHGELDNREWNSLWAERSEPSEADCTVRWRMRWIYFLQNLRSSSHRYRFYFPPRIFFLRYRFCEFYLLIWLDTARK